MLDELHSINGDKSIFEGSKNTTNESFKNVCIAKSFKSSKVIEKVIEKLSKK